MMSISQRLLRSQNGQRNLVMAEEARGLQWLMNIMEPLTKLIKEEITFKGIQGYVHTLEEPDSNV
jgi:hypothetical protein